MILKITKTNPDWLEAIWIEEITTVNEVQEEVDGEIQTIKKVGTQTVQIHCESFSGHREHIQMLKAKCSEFGTELNKEQLLIVKEIQDAFVYPTKEELDAISNEQKLQEAKNYLLNTDWYYARKTETGEEVPTEVVTKRLEAREFIRLNSSTI